MKIYFFLEVWNILSWKEWLFFDFKGESESAAVKDVGLEKVKNNFGFCLMPTATKYQRLESNLIGFLIRFPSIGITPDYINLIIWFLVTVGMFQFQLLFYYWLTEIIRNKYKYKYYLFVCPIWTWYCPNRLNFFILLTKIIFHNSSFIYPCLTRIKNFRFF
jgi:hypothetical protein